ncbi:hypothetical protein B0H11DRAFT_2247267 [Mycena galericulata]|nr:hypothetical protein B0H11DRAFT_1941895 [Mycena galericulata]KAJ7449338.1 hypothetical protein B0H11DRAFT_2247267 [Mycena galericulata]
MKLARVTKFNFGFVDVDYAVQLLTLFDLPALRELSLEDVSASLLVQPPDDTAGLLDWLAFQSSDTEFNMLLPPESTTSNVLGSIESPSTLRLPVACLEALSLHSIHAPQSAFARFFGACADLHVLRMCDVGKEALEALVALEGASSSLPQLHTLTARGVDESLFTHVVNMWGTQLKEIE